MIFVDCYQIFSLLRGSRARREPTHHILGRSFVHPKVRQEIAYVPRVLARFFSSADLEGCTIRTHGCACAHRTAARWQLTEQGPAPSLEGSWSGGGTVSFASGAKEQARCRALYRRAGKSGYTVNATCATASGRAAQVATLRQVGENKYAGSFYNSEYSISGVMHVVVRGSSQTVRLISDSGSAVINLSR
jgi:hypothetical protein